MDVVAVHAEGGPCGACRCAQVQAGMARTGKWWGHQQVAQEDVQPDIMIFAKGIASGFPFAGLATRDNIFEVRSPRPRLALRQAALAQFVGVTGAVCCAARCRH